MAQYINKDDLVEEIEKRLDELWDLLPNASDVIKDNYTKEEANITGKYTALESFEKFINTLEVKEVDFEKEVSIEWDKCNPVDEGMGCEFANISIEQFYSIIKHFFELGLKTQKGK